MPIFLFLLFSQKYSERAIHTVIYIMLRRGELEHRFQRKVLYRVKWSKPILRTLKLWLHLRHLQVFMGQVRILCSFYKLSAFIKNFLVYKNVSKLSRNKKFVLHLFKLRFEVFMCKECCMHVSGWKWMVKVKNFLISLNLRESNVLH